MDNNKGAVKRTLRERKFIDAYIKHNGNATKAYIEDNPNCEYESARVLGCRWLTKVNISVKEFFDRMGLTDVQLHQKLKEGLDATKVISVIPIPPKNEKPSTGDLPDATSKNIEFIDVPDFNVRVKYLDMAYKLKSKYPIDKSRFEITGAGGGPVEIFEIIKTYEQPKQNEQPKSNQHTIDPKAD